MSKLGLNPKRSICGLLSFEGLFLMFLVSLDLFGMVEGLEAGHGHFGKAKKTVDTQNLGPFLEPPKPDRSHKPKPPPCPRCCTNPFDS